MIIHLLRCVGFVSALDRAHTITSLCRRSSWLYKLLSWSFLFIGLFSLLLFPQESCPSYAGMTPLCTPPCEVGVKGSRMRCRSGAFAFDTRWLPCPNPFRPPRSNSDRKRTLIPPATLPSRLLCLTNLFFKSFLSWSFLEGSLFFNVLFPRSHAQAMRA